MLMSHPRQREQNDKAAPLLTMFFYRETLGLNLLGTTAILFHVLVVTSDVLHEDCGVITPVSNDSFLSNTFQLGLPKIHA